jgi:P-type Cu+ transporter
LTLVKGDLNGAAKAFTAEQSSHSGYPLELVLRFIYNVIGVPIVAGILYTFLGLLLNPMIAGRGDVI